ncbi:MULTISPECIES: outer membrane protein assembly factor BamA [unclassified Aureimonas]|uniref:outer membrane protein assembly factor BamA n=1 Tax=unclassified Aureimonas TaxID=2615206 RepID=UPI0006F886F4|nr:MULTISPECIES: outer membrane protein assembly factor BamA [unclassified Aureimonas]KQT60316.1 outer membrane protein assembly factor BamA [Aureimonas sp. Leaf427]KQT79192.1 outer membrane protein assembly factor BamA [Aureimonas sp. Leaf460]
MSAGSKLLRAASAIALSSTVMATALGVQFVGTTTAQAAPVSRIEVRGNQRVEADTIRGLLAIRAGQNISDADIDEGVRKLYSTGLFSDVRISQNGSTVTVEVDENQIVNQVLFQGNSKLKDEQLNAVVQTASRSPYAAAQAQTDVESIREAYVRIGRSDAVVSVRTQPVDNNRVNVIFDVQEGDRTKIGSITFVGNNAFGDGRLKEVIALRETGILSFIQRNDIYDEDRLRSDEETLRRFYYNRGYADFRIVSAVAELDETQNKYFITITLDEGERYTYGAINIDSTIPGVDAESLRSELETSTGDVYSAQKVEDTLVGITNAVASKGYAFAQVTPRGDRDFNNRTISINYVIDQGPRAYIERLEVRGNTKTRDYVIRREFDVSEGDAFNQVLVQRAKQRLENLGFFEKVSISTAPGSEPDRVIVIVDVQEKSTGEFSIGGGYTTGGESEGPVAEIGITERNFLGRGQFVKVSAGFGEDTRNYQLSFTEPYFLGRRLAAGFDIYTSENKSESYDVERVGGSLRLAAPITEDLTAQVAYNFKQEEFGDNIGLNLGSYAFNPTTNLYQQVTQGTAGSSALFATCDAPNPLGVVSSGAAGLGIGFDNAPKYTRSAIINQAICDSPYTTSSISYALAYNTLDSNKDPRNGIAATIGQEVAGLGGDANFVKTTAKAAYFKQLQEEYDIVGQLSAGGGNVTGLGDDLRVFDNFFKGQDIVRGFETKGIGPRQFELDALGNRIGDGVAIGGENYLNASAEATFPLPGISRDLGFRGAVFADAGTLWGSEYAGARGVVGDDLSVRASVGIGLSWASPFGPLRVNYAYPLAKEEYDETQEFSFGFSSRF